MLTLRQLAVRVRTLEPGDSLGKAAEVVRTSTVGAAPVVDGGLLVGLVTAGALTTYLSEGLCPSKAFGAARVADLPLEPAVSLPESLAPLDALRFFEANRLQHAPVIESGGKILGMVSTAELASALYGRARPAVIGGMATPFGVYLTGGGVRAGAGDLALVSTGVYMCALYLAAFWAAVTLFAGDGVLYRKIVSVPQLARWIYDLHIPFFNLAANLTSGLLFAAAFRLSWVTGFHAAEHQVVHAIEAGDDLEIETVRKKPRVHPRCGTNLVAAVLVMFMFWQSRVLEPAQPVLAMLVTALLWRRVGSFLQQYVTTRPASNRQLENGIRAGKQLLERYELRPYGVRGNFQRVWNMGLLQVSAGWLAVFGVLWLLERAGVPLPEALRAF